MSPRDERLRARWHELLRPFGVEFGASGTAFADLSARCSGPRRHYHTLGHVAALLGTLEGFGARRLTPPLLFAAWFHDAVYGTHADDNEERSADLATTTLSSLQVPALLVAETSRLIRMTKTHETRRGDISGCYLLDADLAVLGAPIAEYDRYASAIRKEYDWVPEVAYRAGRRCVLQNFLRRPTIYLTEFIASWSEAMARENLSRELTDGAEARVPRR